MKNESSTTDAAKHMTLEDAVELSMGIMGIDNRYSIERSLVTFSAPDGRPLPWTVRIYGQCEFLPERYATVREAIVAAERWWDKRYAATHRGKQ